MRKYLLCCLAVACLYGDGDPAGRLKPETERQFAEYAERRWTSIDRERFHGGHFLWAGEDSARLSRIRAGEVLVVSIGDKESREISGGLIHDWLGAGFVPGITLDQTLRFLQDYDNNKRIYKPEVVDSKILSRDGDRFQVYLRLLKKKVLTVVLNTEHDIQYTTLDSKRAYSRSISTKIAEVDDAGSRSERELSPGKDHGFLWRLNSYWRFEERDGGVYIECEAISLTRPIPGALVWLIAPIVRDLPRESLTNTITSARKGLLAQLKLAATLH